MACVINNLIFPSNVYKCKITTVPSCVELRECHDKYWGKCNLPFTWMMILEDFHFYSNKLFMDFIHIFILFSFIFTTRRNLSLYLASFFMKQLLRSSGKQISNVHSSCGSTLKRDQFISTIPCPLYIPVLTLLLSSLESTVFHNRDTLISLYL